MAADAIDLSQAIVHASPGDIASWPVTTAIERLTMQPGKDQGLSLVFSGNQSWPDYVPPGWQGPIQYTVWAGVQVAGVWHVAGFIQMWRNRPSTGAPILQYWKEWAYDRNRWGALAEVQPKAGDQMAFFVSAGNARKGSAGAEPDVTSVRERSNVVLVSLPAGDQGVFTFGAVAPPVVAPVPSGHITNGGPQVIHASAADAAALLEEVKTLGKRVRELTEAVKRIQPAPPS